MPVIKAFYPDGAATVMVDQPGISGCTNQFNPPSYSFHGPENHDFVGTQQDYSYSHATWFIGNGCDTFMTIPGCYKYEQRTYFYSSDSGLDPKFRTAYRIFGLGFADDFGFPQYHAYFRINADLAGSSNDYVQRIDRTGAWATIQTEDGYFAQSPFVGTIFRVRDTDISTQRLDIFVPSIDNVPFVTVLQWNPSEVDPTDNSQSNKYLEPIRWANSQNSVNGQDIVVWYETYTTSSATICQPDSACIIGPTIRLKGGL